MDDQYIRSNRATIAIGSKRIRAAEVDHGRFNVAPEGSEEVSAETVLRVLDRRGGALVIALVRVLATAT